MYRILGPVEVELEGPPLSVKGKKPRALLALLILRRNEPVPTELLIENLWGDKAPATAANTLQVYVSQLRKIVADRVSREGGALPAADRSGRARRGTLRAARGRRRRRAAPTVVSRGRRAACRGARPLARTCACGPALRVVRAGRDRAPRGAASRREREPDRGRARARAPRPADRRARSVDRGAPGTRAPPGPAHARALPGGPAGRRARRLPGCPRRRCSTISAWSRGPSCGSSSRRSSARTRRSRDGRCRGATSRARQHARRPQTRAR